MIVHYIGIVILCVGALCILAQAFEKSTGWGVSMLIFGAVLWPVFVLMYWKDTAYWFFVALTGALIAYVF